MPLKATPAELFSSIVDNYAAAEDIRRVLSLANGPKKEVDAAAKACELLQKAFKEIQFIADAVDKRKSSLK